MNKKRRSLRTLNTREPPYILASPITCALPNVCYSARSSSAILRLPVCYATTSVRSLIFTRGLCYIFMIYSKAMPSALIGMSQLSAWKLLSERYPARVETAGFACDRLSKIKIPATIRTWALCQTMGRNALFDCRAQKSRTTTRTSRIKGERKRIAQKFRNKNFSWNERTRTFEAAKKNDPSIMPD